MVGTDDDPSLCSRTPPTLGADPEDDDVMKVQPYILSPHYPRKSVEKRSSVEQEPVIRLNNVRATEITVMVRLRLKNYCRAVHVML